MIIAYEGTPGSGKTYDAVRKIKDNLKKRRRVITNIDGMQESDCMRALQDQTGLDDYEFADLFHHISNDNVIKFFELEVCTPGSMIVIDEAHKFFNSRSWQKRENQAFSDWCSTHRHHGYDLILITQKLTKVDSQAITNVEWTYRYKKINMFGSLVKKGYTIKSYAGDDTTDPIANQVRYYDSKIFRLYQSYATTDIKEMGVQTHANILKHPVFLFIPLVVIFSIFMFTRSGMSKGDLFGANAVLDRVKQNKVVPDEPNSLTVTPKLNTNLAQVQRQPPAGAPAPAGVALPAQVSAPAVPLPGLIEPPVKKLIAVVDGKKIYKCGDRLCTEN